jgi:excinuclease ABC subunit C
MVGREHFILQNAQDETEGALLNSFLLQFYGGGTAQVPRQVVTPVKVEDEAALREWLSTSAGSKVAIKLATGEGARLSQLASRNASEILQQMLLQRANDIQRTSGALLELQEALELPTIPERIECYDISHVQGAYTVASMSVLEDAKPKPSEYRRFRIKTVDQNNDFASMQEVLRRRFSHLVRAAKGDIDERDAEAKWSKIPDLVVIDGGKGQLSSAMDVFHELELEIPTIGLAKEREEVFSPGIGEPLVLPRDSAALFLLQRVRDEAHRFAITYHRQSRGRGALQSSLDEVPGVGPKRRKALLKHFGSIGAIREAPEEQIAAVPGMTRRTAALLKERL